MRGGEYILARIDVVAFSELSRTSAGTDVFDSIEKISSDSNERIRRMAASSNKDLKLECRGHYGDTIDIYFRTGDYDGELILMLLDVVAEAQKMALNLGFFIKGAIVRGSLFVTEKGFTGSAMVDAHELERGCPFPCVTISEDVMKIIDETAHEKFRADQDFVDFKSGIIADGCYLNYIEACPLGLRKNSELNLDIHRRSLILTVERYNNVLPDDSAKCEGRVRMYEYALNNHNRVCDACGAHRERIAFTIEHVNRSKMYRVIINK